MWGQAFPFYTHGIIIVRRTRGQAMDETVRRLKTPEECEQFIKNVQEKYPALAVEARRRAVEMRAAAHGAQTAAE